MTKYKLVNFNNFVFERNLPLLVGDVITVTIENINHSIGEVTGIEGGPHVTDVDFLLTTKPYTEPAKHAVYYRNGFDYGIDEATAYTIEIDGAGELLCRLMKQLAASKLLTPDELCNVLGPLWSLTK